MTKKIRLGTILLAAVICILPRAGAYAAYGKLPDLVISSVQMHWDKGPNPKKATITTTIKNAGTAPAFFDPTYPLVQWLLSGGPGLFGSTPEGIHDARFRGRLLPGQSRTVSFDLPTKDLHEAWHYQICVHVDYINKIKELNDYNNGTCIYFTMYSKSFKHPTLRSSGRFSPSKHPLRLPSKPLQRGPAGRATGRPVLRAGGIMETGVNRRGGDYRSVPLAGPRPAQCRSLCAGDRRCRSWTYVKPGIKGRNAVCYLKKTVPPPRHNTCCVSGVK